MSLHIYNKDLLEFSYLLAKQNQLMNPLEMSKYISSVKDKQVSDRTIRRWLKFLYPHLGYYPYIKYTSLNLQPVAILIKNLKN